MISASSPAAGTSRSTSTSTPSTRTSCTRTRSRAPPGWSDDPPACRCLGAGTLLARMHDAGLVVVLASSASEDDLQDMRKVFDADDAIDAVVNADDVERSKPDPAIFDTARQKGGIDPTLVLAVGDTVWDVQAARAAGMGCVTVESGGSSRAELSDAGAIAVYRDVQELSDQLMTSPIGNLINAEERPCEQ
ncbi:MAG: HAD family hydrolase [Microbacterium sp.]